MSGAIMEGVSSFNKLRGCFSQDGVPSKDEKMRLDEELQAFGQQDTRVFLLNRLYYGFNCMT